MKNTKNVKAGKAGKAVKAPKIGSQAYWTLRASRIAASRKKNERLGETERERRARVKAEKEAIAMKAAKVAAKGTRRTTDGKFLPKGRKKAA